MNRRTRDPELIAALLGALKAIAVTAPTLVALGLIAEQKLQTAGAAEGFTVIHAAFAVAVLPIGLALIISAFRSARPALLPAAGVFLIAGAISLQRGYQIADATALLGISIVALAMLAGLLVGLGLASLAARSPSGLGLVKIGPGRQIVPSLPSARTVEPAFTTVFDPFGEIARRMPRSLSRR